MDFESSVTPRPLCQNDSAFLCSIFKDNPEYYRIFFDPANTLDQWESRVSRFLSQNEVCHQILEAEGRPVGWLSYYDTEDGLRELCVLVLHPDFLGKGYGAQSLSLLLERSRADQIRSVLLHVTADNARAIRLYQMFGFEIIGEEVVPECNDATNLVQYIMEKKLS